MSSLAKMVEKIEAKAKNLESRSAYEAFLETSRLYIESGNLREWLEFGFLPGRPDSVWKPRTIKQYNIWLAS